MIRVLIRCEAGGEHGLGHAVRCKTLGQALHARGADIAFLTTTPLLTHCVAPFACSYVTDTSERGIVGGIRGHDPDIVVFDTKVPFDEHLYSLIRERGACPPDADHETTTRIVRIDHPYATPDSCDLLIGPCVHWDQQTVSCLHDAFGLRFLYGWDYVMLDQEVVHAPVVGYGERRHRVVFCAGGSDPGNALEHMYRLTQDLELCRQGAVPELVFAIGAHATMPRCGAGPRAMATIVTPFTRLLLRRASLIVSMFGQTIYECLWYHTPVLMLSHTDENDWGAFHLTQASCGAARRLGPLAAQRAASFTHALTRCWENVLERQQMHEASQGLLDGCGAARVADAILGLA